MRLKKVTLFEFYTLARVCFVVIPTVLLPAVTFDLFDFTGRITDASFENVCVHMQKKYPRG